MLSVQFSVCFSFQGSKGGDVTAEVDGSYLESLEIADSKVARTIKQLRYGTVVLNPALYTYALRCAPNDS